MLAVRCWVLGVGYWMRLKGRGNRPLILSLANGFPITDYELQKQSSPSTFLPSPLPQGLQIADYGLQTTDYGLQTTDYRLAIGAPKQTSGILKASTSGTASCLRSQQSWLTNFRIALVFTGSM